MEGSLLVAIESLPTSRLQLHSMFWWGTMEKT